MPAIAEKAEDHEGLQVFIVLSYTSPFTDLSKITVAPRDRHDAEKAR